MNGTGCGEEQKSSCEWDNVFTEKVHQDCHMQRSGIVCSAMSEISLYGAWGIHVVMVGMGGRRGVG